MAIPAICLSPPTTTTSIALAWIIALVSAVVLGLTWYLKHIDRGDRQRWRREAELRQQIWRESLPDWQREAIAEADRKRTEMKQEARCRSGLPEETLRMLTTRHPANFIYTTQELNAFLRYANEDEVDRRR
jgi:hypothetical protein